MNLSAKLFVLFLTASLALIALHPDSLAAALVPLVLCSSFCVDLFLKSKRDTRSEHVDQQLKALKERLDMLVIQKGLSR